MRHGSTFALMLLGCAVASKDDDRASEGSATETGSGSDLGDEGDSGDDDSVGDDTDGGETEDGPGETGEDDDGGDGSSSDSGDGPVPALAELPPCGVLGLHWEYDVLVHGQADYYWDDVVDLVQFDDGASGHRMHRDNGAPAPSPILYACLEDRIEFRAAGAFSTEYDPPDPMIMVPLFVGDQWSSTFSIAGNEYTVVREVIGVETIDVAAGTFDTVVIHATSQGPGGSEQDVWISPEVGIVLVDGVLSGSPFRQELTAFDNPG